MARLDGFRQIGRNVSADIATEMRPSNGYEKGYHPYRAYVFVHCLLHGVPEVTELRPTLLVLIHYLICTRCIPLLPKNVGKYISSALAGFSA